MGVFEQFPYANMHEMNLDWLLKKMKELAAAMETFKATESLKFADPIIWDITTQYEKSTIVLDPTGNAYLSLQPVPTGVQLNNSEYWLEIFNFTDYTRTANQNLTINVETNTTRATAAYQVDDWLIWNDVLYRVTSAIAVDNVLIAAPATGSNIIHFTVEDFIKAFITYATELINQYKNEIDASELAYRQQLAQDIANTTASLQAQLNAAISGATVDSEVINARVDLNGYIWSTLGDAIRNQISRVTSLSDVLSNIMNDTAQSFTLLQGYHGTNKGVFVSSSQQAETDFIAVPTGTTITVNCSVNTTQCFIKEWARISDGYSRVRNIMVTAGTTATISDTSSNYFYTMGGYNANDIDASDSHITITIDNLLSQKYDELATAPINQTALGITDCNLMVDAGFYNVNASGYTNLPSDFTSNGVLIVLANNSTRLLQILASYGTNDFWMRNAGSNNGFSSWCRLDNSMDPNQYIPINRAASGITDCNLMTDPGFYLINTSGYTNIPTDLSGNGILFTFRTNQTSRMMQVIGSYGSCDFWMRNAGSNNGFTEWTKLSTHKEVKIIQENADQFAISFGKARVQLIHTVDAGLYQDSWNLQNIYKGNNLIVPSGSDIIGPISINNTFIGGVHGYETTEEVTFIADGNIYNLNTITDLFCDRLEMLIKSKVYDPSNPNTALADRYIKLIFTADKMEVESTYQALTAFTADRCYVGGMISAKNDILQGIALNNMFISAPTAAVSGTIKKCNTRCSMLTSNGTVTINVTKGFEDPDYVGKIIVYTGETPIRSKFYGDIQGTGTRSVSIGDNIHGSFEITVN